MTASTANLWAVAGLVYALAGASLFALSVFSQPHPAAERPDQTLHESVGHWLDGRIGAGLILAGFFFQLTGAVGTTTLNTPAIFVLLGLALAAGYYALSKDLLIEKIAAGTAQAPRALPLAPVPERAPAPVIVAPVEPQAETIVVESETVVIDLRRESTG